MEYIDIIQNAILPEDLQHEWISLMRRLRSVCKTGSLTILDVTVLVGPDGLPKAWLTPTARRVEPRKGTEDILELLLASRVIDEDITVE